MGQETPDVAYGPGGLRGIIDRPDGPTPVEPDRVTVRFEDGLRISMPSDQLRSRGDGGYDLPFDLAELERLRRGEGLGPDRALVVPVVAEELEVRRRTVETGRVRITKVVSQREGIVDEPLLREEVHVERVPVNRLIDEPVAIRQEGDTTIIPLVEEVAVVTKRLLLREELHVTRSRSEGHDARRITLRAEDAVVERVLPLHSGEES